MTKAQKDSLNMLEQMLIKVKGLESKCRKINCYESAEALKTFQIEMEKAIDRDRYYHMDSATNSLVNQKEKTVIDNKERKLFDA